ncbi:polysaccharide biosynthesis tyrosine autokinase [Bacteroides sp. 224]|uniref:GumC family protein n=1 Tax=Bacteroides sp. 224 TaxID=2302936 RepID=UPI0013D338F3|nr:polysaccharide biosynthesis tyrosine autokinase [Bacteroides sp. 224]NDV66829.1 polysaccharide biosynthesis tyrosine autokinase [Bacteroides sp. 224]
MVQNNLNKQADDFIRIQDLFYIFLNKWYWFVIAVVVSLSVALFYLAKTSPVYTRSASILIKDNSNGGGVSAENAAFADLGIFKSNTNIINELHTFQSPSLMTEVVRRLKLDYSYKVREGLRKRELYTQTPCTIGLGNVSENQSFSCVIELLPDRKFRLTEMMLNDLEVDSQSTEGALSDSIATVWGTICIQPTLYYSENSVGTNILFSKTGIQSTSKIFSEALAVNMADDKSSIIDLRITDVSTRRAEDILNTLIQVYNESWIKDKNQVAISTSAFIDDRLAIIEAELGHVDDDISNFKSKNLLPDVQAVSTMFMAQSSENKSRIFELENQLSITRFIREYMDDPKQKDQLLPANAGIENANIGSLINEYNSALLQRNNLLANSSEKNPLVIDLNQSLVSMRQSVISSLDNSITTLDKQIGNIRRSDTQTNRHIASSPNQAKYLLSVERQQKVKEALYLYLLQKREENELSQAFTAYNTKVINMPSGSNFPTAPVKRNILLVALAIGLLIPAVILFLLESLNNKIRLKKDLDGMSLPYVGEIPLAETGKKSLLKKGHTTSTTIAVKEKNRDQINEAFRIIRTNLNFMKGNQENSKIIMITSFNPGSGKTFTTANLGVSLSLAGKKVIAIDLDMRRGALSAYVNSPKQGVSNYLAGLTDNINEIIVKGSGELKLDIIPVGVFPPNPTELLLNERLQLLLNTLEKQYDYVLIDCTPVEIVADTSIVGKLVDMTLFIIRAGLLDKRMLPELERMYSENKLNNMAVLLNGVDVTARYGRYGGYGYGYYGK